jgi:hypothetical protein
VRIVDSGPKTGRQVDLLPIETGGALVWGRATITRQGPTLDLSPPWWRVVPWQPAPSRSARSHQRRK